MGPRRFSSHKIVFIEDIIFIFQEPIGQKSNLRKYLNKKIKIAVNAQNLKIRNHDKIAILIDVFKRKGAQIPDVDNLAKPILDALKGIIYHDDKQIELLQVNALKSDPNGSIHPIYLPITAIMCKEAKENSTIFISIGRVESENGIPKRKSIKNISCAAMVLNYISLVNPLSSEGLKKTIDTLKKQQNLTTHSS